MENDKIVKSWFVTFSNILTLTLVFCCLLFLAAETIASPGALDTSFAGTGRIRQGTGAGTAGTAIAYYPTGKFVVAGSGHSGSFDLLVARYNMNGTLDSSFNGNGIVLTYILGGSTTATAVKVLTDGRIVVSGVSNGFFVVVRYNADGSLDSTFDGDGIATTMLDNNTCFAYAMGLQADGKIVLAGSCLGVDYALVRYNTNGSLDTTFDGDGIAYTQMFGENTAYALTFQLDGKIIVAGGGADFCIARYNTDGSLDTTFDGDGIATVDFGGSNDAAYAVVVQVSDLVVSPTLIVVAGTGANDFALARFNLNGTLDPTFDGDGKMTKDISGGADKVTGLTVNTNFPARITVSGTAGTVFGLAKFQLNGAVDTTFGSNGIAVGGFSGGSTEGLGLLNFGFLTVVGYFNGPSGQTLALAQFMSNGTFSTTFGGGGMKLETGIGSRGEDPRGSALQPDGKIIVVGATPSPASFGVSRVLRYNPDGSPDTSFNGTGVKTISFPGSSYDVLTATALQPDGKIVVAGFSLGVTDFDFVAARLNPDGSLDTSFDFDGMVTTALVAGRDQASSLAIQPDGKILVAGFAVLGNHHMAVVRYNPNGSLDTSFENDGIVILNSNLADDAIAVKVQPDNKIVIAGNGDSGQSSGQDFIVQRLNSNGLLDTTFDGDGKATTNIGTFDTAGSLNLQNDGKILVTGSVADTGLEDVFAAIRYNTNGSLDTTFDGDGRMTKQVGPLPNRCRAATIQPDGKLLLAGQADNTFAVARFNPDGSTDSSYGIGGTAKVDYSDNETNIVLGVSLDTTGRTVIAGNAGGMIGVGRLLGISSPRAPFDYDGDGRSDISVFRPSTGAWYLNRSTAGVFGTTWGISTDKITPADYDGDGKTDIAIFRPSEGRWYILNSATSTFTSSLWGAATDIPAPADYDGDGRADVAIFRPSDGNWWLNRTTLGTTTIPYGQNGDIPAVGDYDGDGKADIAIFRPSNGAWSIHRSSGGDTGYQFGFGTDKLAQADYDGDGKTDIAIYRPSTGQWFIANSGSATYPVIAFGAATDIPTPGDYDGDGKADVAIFRPSDGNWWLNRSTAGVTVMQFGQNGDKPVPNAYGN